MLYLFQLILLGGNEVDSQPGYQALAMRAWLFGIEPVPKEGWGMDTEAGVTRRHDDEAHTSGMAKIRDK